jgi:dipeptide/tripeptide permease
MSEEKKESKKSESSTGKAKNKAKKNTARTLGIFASLIVVLAFFLPTVFYALLMVAGNIFTVIGAILLLIAVYIKKGLNKDSSRKALSLVLLVGAVLIFIGVYTTWS